MATSNKTVETNTSVANYVASIENDSKREDFEKILASLSMLTSTQPKMWGSSIVGFGSYHYQYDSGREGDAPLVGVSSRASTITFYLGSFDDKIELLTKLGKHKTGKGCLHIKRLADIDEAVLSSLIQSSISRFA